MANRFFGPMGRGKYKTNGNKGIAAALKETKRTEAEVRQEAFRDKKALERMNLES